VAVPAPISPERRQAAVDDYRRRNADGSRISIAAVAAEHGVGPASLKRWLWSATPKRPRGGAKPKLTTELVDQLVELATSQPTLRLYELAAEMSRRAGQMVSEATVGRALRSRNIGKRRIVREPAPADPRESDGTRYGARHRRQPEDRPHRRAYPSDFTDAEWAVVEPIWLEHVRALPTEHELRDVLDALRYIGATGCPWRFLPHEYPPFTTVRTWFDRWKRDGTVDLVNSDLRRRLRRRSGREDTPSLLIVDSQTAKAREGGKDRGYDGGKKTSGRKRHIAVDTEGLPWLIIVHSAAIQDRDGIDLLVPDHVRQQQPRLKKILADGGYQGRAERITAERTGVPLHIVRRLGDTTTGQWAAKDGPPPSAPAGFQVVPQRWIVERSHAWVCRRRRLSSAYERSAATSAEWYRHAWQFTMTARAAG
jgi:putative transposase